MKVRLERNGIVFEYEKAPLPPERFRAVCRLAGVLIAGVVFLTALRLVGVAAVFGALGALLMVGLYNLAKE